MPPLVHGSRTKLYPPEGQSNFSSMRAALRAAHFFKPGRRGDSDRKARETIGANLSLCGERIAAGANVLFPRSRRPRLYSRGADLISGSRRIGSQINDQATDANAKPD